jgi:acetyl esterase/lipase
MLDDRNIASNESTGRLVLWSHAVNKQSWNLLLGGMSENPAIPVTSAAGRMTLEQAQGLPPIYLDIGERDIFRDESAEFVQNWPKQVSIELHALPGLEHALDGSSLGTS